jgi:hypothetical protein
MDIIEECGRNAISIQLIGTQVRVKNNLDDLTRFCHRGFFTRRGLGHRGLGWLGAGCKNQAYDHQQSKQYI